MATPDPLGLKKKTKAEVYTSSVKQAKADEKKAQALLKEVAKENKQLDNSYKNIQEKCGQNSSSSYCNSQFQTYASYDLSAVNAQIEQAAQYSYNAFKLYKSAAASWQSYGQYVYSNNAIAYAQNIVQRTGAIEVALQDGAQVTEDSVSLSQDFVDFCEMFCG